MAHLPRGLTNVHVRNVRSQRLFDKHASGYLGLALHTAAAKRGCTGRCTLWKLAAYWPRGLTEHALGPLKVSVATLLLMSGCLGFAFV